ncbi:phosphohistidine phosphatase [Motilibacter peucedani]|uniref:Phosphohistidine phosphatase n=1 Tax=Motilibacter peucedani TaxID=598650 RepID=A0A420XJW1_9ACTN|nr:histidine phosphatase family protein [Motilibacter peucedani]RKS68041.1 phosphohistidine phosphatase [Motilibacter peucedani]
MPTLVVVRHGEAERAAPGTDDIDRQLARQGRADAAAAGQWVAEHVGRPGLVVGSPALRARQTVDALVAAWDERPTTVVDEAVYEASLGDLLRVVRGLDDDEDVIALVGHNPGLSLLVGELTSEPSDLATSSVAVVEVPSAWADTPAFACRLVSLETPRA